MTRPSPLDRLRRTARSAYITAQLAHFLASPGRRENPRAAYARVRKLDPVHRSPLGVFVLTAHAEVSHVLRDPRFSSSEDHIDLSRLRLGPLRWALGRNDGAIEEGPFFEQGLLLFLDPPDHTRLRRLASRSFTARRVADLEPRIADIADELLAPIGARGRTELMSEFAYPFPARVICELIGVPDPDTHHIIDNAPALAAGLDPGPMLSAEAAPRATRLASRRQPAPRLRRRYPLLPRRIPRPDRGADRAAQAARRPRRLHPREKPRPSAQLHHPRPERTPPPRPRHELTPQPA